MRRTSGLNVTSGSNDRDGDSGGEMEDEEGEIRPEQVCEALLESSENSDFSDDEEDAECEDSSDSPEDYDGDTDGDDGDTEDDYFDHNSDVELSEDEDGEGYNADMDDCDEANAEHEDRSGENGRRQFRTYSKSHRRRVLRDLLKREGKEKSVAFAKFVYKKYELGDQKTPTNLNLASLSLLKFLYLSKRKYVHLKHWLKVMIRLKFHIINNLYLKISILPINDLTVLQGLFDIVLPSWETLQVLASIFI